MPDTTVTVSIRRGVRDGLDVILGYVPFGLALGAALASAGVAPWTAWLSSALIFAGAAQLVAVQMLGAGAAVVLVVVTGLVVNARHVLYSAALAPYVAGWSRGQRWAAAYLLADPVYALAAARFRGDGEAVGQGPRAGGDRSYYFGMAVTCWFGWLALTGAGVALGGILPAGLPLEIATPLTFLLLVLPMLDTRPALAAALVGGVVALLASGLPLGTGLLLGGVAGIAAGVAVDRREVGDPAHGGDDA